MQTAKPNSDNPAKPRPASARSAAFVYRSMAFLLVLGAPFAPLTRIELECHLEADLSADDCK